MVSEREFLTTDRGDVETALNAAAMVADGYRARVGKVMDRVEVGSPLFDLMRQVIDRTEPHFNDRDAFNAAFVGRASAVMNVFAANKTAIEDTDKWKVFKMALLSLCSNAGASSGERLASASKKKAETWLQFAERFSILANQSGLPREMQVKTFFKKLPTHLRRAIATLPTNTTMPEMVLMVRNVTFWMGSSSTSEIDKEAMDVDAADAEFGSETTNVNAFGRGLPLRELCDAMRGELSRNPRFAGIMEEILGQWRQRGTPGQQRGPQGQQRGQRRPGPRRPSGGRHFQGNCYQCGEFGHSAKFCPHRYPQVREAQPVPTNNQFEALASFDEEEEEAEGASVLSVRLGRKERAQGGHGTQSPTKNHHPEGGNKSSKTSGKADRGTDIKFINYPRVDQTTQDKPVKSRASLKVATYLSNRPEKEQALVDTGAEVSLLPLGYCQRWGLKVRRLENTRLRGFNNTVSRVTGEVTLPTRIGGWNQAIPYYVTDATDKVILGYSALKKFGLMVDCSNDCLLGEDGHVVFCRSISSN